MDNYIQLHVYALSFYTWYIWAPLEIRLGENNDDLKIHQKNSMMASKFILTGIFKIFNVK